MTPPRYDLREHDAQLRVTFPQQLSIRRSVISVSDLGYSVCEISRVLDYGSPRTTRLSVRTCMHVHCVYTNGNHRVCERIVRRRAVRDKITHSRLICVNYCNAHFFHNAYLFHHVSEWPVQSDHKRKCNLSSAK